MRLRIQTYHPLPDIKAWFIPDVPSAPESVHDLKETLCLRFQALKVRKFSAQDLILLLDDFELLNDSPFSAVRDGDLICVKLSPLAQVDDVESNITRQRKRKRSPSATLRISGQSVRAPTVLPKQKAAEPSEGSDSESDSTTSSATTSSSSASSSSSSSRSSSSPTSSSPPKPSNFQPTQQADNMTVPNSTSRIISPVPPGLGKPSTHSRNKRRRLKKDYEKEALSTSLSADTPGPPKGSSYTNKLPLGQRKSEPGPSSHPPDQPSAKLPSQLPSETNAQESYLTLNQVMMGSLRNKNKKKGFKQSMAAPIPQKIIFTSNTMASESQEQQPSSSTRDMLTDEISTSAGAIQPRLVPPSEIQELGQLPPNMFVTSVDVESEMWNEHPSSPKKEGKKKKTLNGDRYCATTDWHDSSQMEGITENGQFDDADLGLATDTRLNAITTQSTISGAPRPFDWDRAERLWKESTVLDKLEQLAIGCLVGWKALAINPQTFSPEMLLMVARVVNISQSTLISSESTQDIVIRYLQRPGASRAALAFGLNGEQVEEDEETLEWTDILTRQWRVMQL